MTAIERFLVVHHRTTYCGFNDEVLDWIATNLPGERARFHVRALPCSLFDFLLQLLSQELDPSDF
jgi:hypothetical protein